MIDARGELTLKFSELPPFKLIPAKTILFSVQCGAEVVTVEVKQKSFKKLESAPLDLPPLAAGSLRSLESSDRALRTAFD